MGGKTADPICSVETATSPLLPDDQVTTPPPRPVKEEGDVTLTNTDIPDSIARALFDALQEKQIGSELPATVIALARVRGAQLQPWLATERDHQVISSSLPKFHGEP